MTSLFHPHPIPPSDAETHVFVFAFAGRFVTSHTAWVFIGGDGRWKYDWQPFGRRDPEWERLLETKEYPHILDFVHFTTMEVLDQTVRRACGLPDETVSDDENTEP